MINNNKKYITFLALASTSFALNAYSNESNNLENDLKIKIDNRFSAKNINRENPNIIFILCDDAGYGDFSSYGQDKIKTPNIENLANNGLKWTNHYAGSTVSAPSRCSLLTGFNTGHSYIRGNKEVLPVGQEPLGENVITVAEMIKENKKTSHYKTAIIGKWGLGAPNTHGEPTLKGFDYFYGYNCQREAHTYYPDYLWRATARGQKAVKEINKFPKNSDQNYSHDKLTNDALKFIADRNTNKENYFLYLAYTIPHSRLELPYKYLKEFGYNKKAWPKSMKNFAAMISLMDRDIGRIVDLVGDTNTIIMFASDNGAHAEGGANPSFFNSTGNFKGIKRDLYEGGIRVPFITYWKNVITPKTTNLVSSFWDFAPTVADILGLENTNGLKTDGISYAPTLLNKTQEKKHKYLYWEFHEGTGKQAVLKDGYKLIRLDAKISPKFELYNINTDPFETTNIIKDNKKIFDDLLYIMKNARTESAIFSNFKDFE